ncbi:endonuclease/exonuclease/phosphatase family protein [Ferrimonas pelagia]|uniref:Endonuclease/exonuclease/phosphatase family protein n=1 Tax=Ferrimonas pelagia TaxID=1177826 RepID=A0ABP9ESU5_9GAMM
MSHPLLDCPARFRLATLNLFNYLAPPRAYYAAENIYSATQWQQKQQWLSRYLGQLDADIVGFQEVFSPQVLQAQVAQCGYAHFAAVDQPKVEQGFIHFSPPVALASRFPIVRVEAVRPAASALAQLEWPDFAFSRQPLRAEIAIPGFGRIRIYVVHLKSQRTELAAEGSLAQQIWLQPKLGAWLSMRQRTAEAALLLADMLAQPERLPTVLMGDLNDVPTSATLTQFQAPKRLPLRPPGSSVSELEIQQAIDAHAMQCAFTLALERSEQKPTHYWGPVATTLDHILLSAEFDPTFGQSMAQVDWCEVFDRHLVRNDTEADRQCSDHAAVLAQISGRF